MEMMHILSGKQVSLSFWTTSYLRGFQGSSALQDDNLETLFRMLYLSFVQPRIDGNGVNLVTGQRRTALIREAGSPEEYFFREITRVTHSNHPRFTPLEPEDLDLVNAAAALDFLHRALNPADYTFVLVGSLSRAPQLRELAAAWLASIPAGSKTLSGWIDPGFTRPGKTEKIVRKGREEKSIVYMGWFIPLEWNEETNASALVLNEYLDIVLTDEIRESMGGVYSVEPYVSFSPVPKGELSLEIYFVCDPRREAELRGAIRERLSIISGGDINEETLRRAREAKVKNFEQSMEGNLFIARNAAQFSVALGIPLSHLEERPAMYRSVTAEQIRSMIAAALRGGPAELVLLPQE
jgi:zinc protease